MRRNAYLRKGGDCFGLGPRNDPFEDFCGFVMVDGPAKSHIFAVVGRAFLPDHGYKSQSDCLDRQECPSYSFLQVRHCCFPCQTEQLFHILASNAEWDDAGLSWGSFFLTSRWVSLNPTFLKSFRTTPYFLVVMFSTTCLPEQLCRQARRPAPQKGINFLQGHNCCLPKKAEQLFHIFVVNAEWDSTVLSCCSYFLTSQWVSLNLPFR